MGDSLSEFIDSVASVVIAVFAIAFIAYAIAKYSKYDKFLIDRNDVKSTSRYTTAYAGFETDYTDAMVLNDILSSDAENIVINGTSLTEAMLKGAREGSETDISAIKSYLTGNFIKRYSFDGSGNITGLFYESH